MVNGDFYVMWFLCSSVSWLLFASAAWMGGDINEDRVWASTDFASVRSGDVNALSLALATDALCKSASIGSAIRQMHDLVLHWGHGIIISRRHYWESRHCRLQVLTVKGCDETPWGERSTSTYLQRESFMQTALETGIKEQTQINLSDHLSSHHWD